MAQWKTNPRVLIVHGGGGCESEDSYITVVAVPNLGCLDCKKLRDEFYADSMDGTYENKAIPNKIRKFRSPEVKAVCVFSIFPFQRQIDADIYASSVISQFTPNTVVLIVTRPSIQP